MIKTVRNSLPFYAFFSFSFFFPCFSFFPPRRICYGPFSCFFFPSLFISFLFLCCPCCTRPTKMSFSSLLIFFYFLAWWPKHPQSYLIFSLFIYFYFLSFSPFASSNWNVVAPFLLSFSLLFLFLPFLFPPLLFFGFLALFLLMQSPRNSEREGESELEKKEQAAFKLAVAIVFFIRQREEEG